MKIALVHDYLVQSGGAERVIATLHRLFPAAPIFTTIAEAQVVQSLLPTADIRTSWMQHLPGYRKHYRKYFFLYPRAIESLDLSEFDLIVSNSSAFAKGVRTRPDACHVCYCHTPMRFAWDFEGYSAREGWGALTLMALKPMIKRVRAWDLATSRRPTAYLANSSTSASRIARCYGLPADIVFPPVDIGRFTPAKETGDYHLVVSRLVGYKRIDLAVRAFNQLGRRLVVIGDGPARASLEAMAGPTIEFLGRVGDDEAAEYYRRCWALIFPGEEDFGLTPLEANASGRPVVAYAAGGALDTVVDGTTGVFFEKQEPDSLIEAVRRCETIVWDQPVLRQHAESFGEDVFRLRMARAIATAVKEKLPRARFPGASSAPREQPVAHR